MLYQFEFRTYQRKFKRPLRTSHGLWDIRSGIILRLVGDNNRISWGEIAPLSWFGSESFEQALDFCHQLPANLSSEMIFAISAELPACQFGFESALSNLSNSFVGSAGERILGGRVSILRGRAARKAFPGRAWERG